MGKLSGSLIYAAVWCGALLWIAAEAQTPSKLLGIDASGYGSYDPDVAVGAGLPSQAGQNGNCLTTTGTALSWGACGSGGGAALSDKTPQPDGTAAAGAGTEASRDDHVHQIPAAIATNTATGTANKASITTIETQLGDVRGVPQPTNANKVGNVLTLTDTSVRSGNYEWMAPPSGGGDGASLSNQTPKPLGTAAAGSGTAASRDDHVHLLPAEIAGNTTQIAANNQSINRNHTSIAALGGVKNPALASGTAGYLVRQKSDHSAYEVVDPDTAVLDGLPAITGHAGKFLAVNSVASGLEWASGGGGGGGASASEIVFHTRSTPSSDSASATLDPTNVGALKEFLLLDQAKILFARIQSSGGTFLGYISSSPVILRNPITDCDASGYRIANPLNRNSDDGLFNFVLNVGFDDADCENLSSASISYTNLPTYESSWRGKRLQLVGLTLAGGGGGGGDNPTIPKPTAAGANRFLRVNSGGSAYELAAVVQGHPFGVSGDIQGITSGSVKGGTSARVARADHVHSYEPYELPGPQSSPVLAETPIQYNAGAVGHSLETGFDLDDVPDGPVYIRVTDPDHNTGVYSIWTTRAKLMSLTAISAGSMASQVLQNHVILRNQSGQAAGYFAGRITGSNDLWVSAPATHASGGTLHATAVSESGWAEYAVKRNAPEDFPGYGNVLAIKSGASIQGSAKTVARSDHQHAVPGALYGNPVAVGTANAGGSATTLARSDHVHKGATSTDLATTDAQVGVNTQDIEANKAKIASLQGRGSTSLWTHTATATQWANGDGRTLTAGVNAKIWAGFNGGAATGWRGLEAEIKFRVTGSTNVSHYGTIVFGTHRAGDQSADDASRIWGSGFVNGTLLHAVIHLPQQTAFNSTPGTMHIDNCSFCTQGSEELAVNLYGVL